MNPNPKQIQASGVPSAAFPGFLSRGKKLKQRLVAVTRKMLNLPPKHGHPCPAHTWSTSHSHRFGHVLLHAATHRKHQHDIRGPWEVQALKKTPEHGKTHHNEPESGNVRSSQSTLSPTFPHKPRAPTLGLVSQTSTKFLKELGFFY